MEPMEEANNNDEEPLSIKIKQEPIEEEDDFRDSNGTNIVKDIKREPLWSSVDENENISDTAIKLEENGNIKEEGFVNVKAEGGGEVARRLLEVRIEGVVGRVVEVRSEGVVGGVVELHTCTPPAEGFPGVCQDYLAYSCR